MKDLNRKQENIHKEVKHDNKRKIQGDSESINKRTKMVSEYQVLLAELKKTAPNYLPTDYLEGKKAEELIKTKKVLKRDLKDLNRRKKKLEELTKQLSEQANRKLEGSKQVMEGLSELATRVMIHGQAPKEALKDTNDINDYFNSNIKMRKKYINGIEKLLKKEKEYIAYGDKKIVIDGGTMQSVVNKEVIQNYINGLNSMTSIKTNFILENLPLQENLHLVDIGCMTGKVAHEISESRPEIQVEGIDIDPRYIQQATETYPRLKFRVGDPSKGLPYNDNTVSAFSLSAVMHEVYTYNDFSIDPVKKTLTEMYRVLIPGGRVILKEPAMPQEPDELLHITLSSANGANPETDEALLETHPRELSAQSLMRRFLHQFKVLKLDRNQHMKEQIISKPDGSYTLPAWLIGEFLRKRTYNDTQEHWNAEMGEQNAPFTSGELAKLAQETGFQENKMSIRDVFERDFYGTLKENDGISITNLNGNRINQAERFPSHVYAILEK